MIVQVQNLNHLRILGNHNSHGLIIVESDQVIKLCCHRVFHLCLTDFQHGFWRSGNMHALYFDLLLICRGNYYGFFAIHFCNDSLEPLIRSINNNHFVSNEKKLFKILPLDFCYVYLFNVLFQVLSILKRNYLNRHLINYFLNYFTELISKQTGLDFNHIAFLHQEELKLFLVLFVLSIWDSYLVLLFSVKKKKNFRLGKILGFLYLICLKSFNQKTPTEKLLLINILVVSILLYFLLIIIKGVKKFCFRSFGRGNSLADQSRNHLQNNSSVIVVYACYLSKISLVSSISKLHEFSLLELVIIFFLWVKNLLKLTERNKLHTWSLYIIKAFN
jgi:hypothetical protein